MRIFSNPHFTFRSDDDRSPQRDRDRERHADRRNDRNRSPDRRNRSPDRRDRSSDRRNRNDDNRRNKQSPERRRNNDDRRDDRNNDRRRSRSRDRNSGGGGGFRNKQRRNNNSRGDDGGNYEWGKRDCKDEPEDEPVEKEKPNFGLSGKLTEETNKVAGVVIKYAEPPEAKKPKRRWRLYPFKGETALPTLFIHRQSGYLIGRDRKVCDIPVDHPSCSKQHAALQYRLVPYERVDGSSGKRVRPYIIDLESANGTFVNNKKIDSKKYVELLEKDVIKFGFSSREYVMLHESSKEEEAEDDDDMEVVEEEAPAAAQE